MLTSIFIWFKKRVMQILVNIRRGLDVLVLTGIFGVAPGTVSIIFTKWND